MNPELDLKILIMNSLKIKKNIFMSEIQMDNIELGTFDSYFIRRIKGEPISKILNSKEFWSLDYFTNKYVLDPRPETEMFIEYITKNFNDFNTDSNFYLSWIIKFF